MPNAVSFRRFQPTDAEIVPALFISALRSVYPDIESGEWTSDLDHVEEAYVNDGGDFLVGVMNNSIVAIGGLHRVNEHTVEMKRVAVSPGVQGSGIGQELVTALEQRARELGFTTMVLDTTFGQKAARYLYEKNGYVQVDRQKVDHPSGHTFDTFFYEKKL